MSVSGALLTQVSVGAVALYTLVTAASRAIDRLLALAEYYDIDEVLVGMTVLALGTSLPELSAHLVASLGILSGVLDYQVASAVVIGGNTGSSTVQQFLLVGVLLIACGSLPLTRTFVRRSYLPMLGALLATLLVAWDGSISRLDGSVLLALYLIYVLVSVSNREPTGTIRERPSERPRRDALVATGLLVLVLLAASLVLSVVGTVVDMLALGGSTVGVVTIGVAAALPELTTVMDAVRRRAPNVALGTLVGSNIVNPLVGIGLGGVVSTYYVPPVVVLWDLPFKLGVGGVLLGWVRFRRTGRLTRTEGGYLLGLYFVFISGRLLLFPGQ
ncbi:sodium:calcium antiporter [Haloplanus aerogenes]|uniref:Cation:H+ antiporter n=1 Tax=Haloplanus aerogenes TaxID=660522 RepID=A0A3M0CWT7_9EURY|nr:sodium:calcium antiporter [Haloplanus aerogenes]AZH25087.1 sodium:calcium antiporter [Haloplanus aerogenes]RMB13692.1 cation:H+ antiporter [Haloplanus aerogenes]